MLGTFQNVPLELFKMFLNIQKVPEHVCKHFKSKCRVKKCLRTNSEFFRKKFWELLKMFMWKFVGEHFRMFHWNFLKCSWTFKKFAKEFVNILKCLQSECSIGTFKKVSEQFKMFHWNFLKYSWTFKKFPNMFVNISNQSVEWKNVWEQTQKFSKKCFENY